MKKTTAILLGLFCLLFAVAALAAPAEDLTERCSFRSGSGRDSLAQCHDRRYKTHWQSSGGKGAWLEITLPEGVTTLGKNAFALSGLERITLPAGLTAIGDGCFAYTPLEAAELPEGLSTIGAEAFVGCDGLEQMVIPAGVTELPGKLFAGCSRLRSVTLPEGLLRIGSSAFMLCGSDRDPLRLNLPATLEFIAGDAFLYCEACIHAEVIPGTVGEGFVQEKNISHTYREN